MTLLMRYMSSTTSTSKKHYDIVVSGGGMIGTALTSLLAQSPLCIDRKILLIEPTKQKKWSLSPAYSNRVSSVNRGTKQLMERIGAWDTITQTRLKPVMSMKVWDCTGGKLEFENDNKEPVAYIVENDILIDAVERKVKDAKNVTVLNEARVKEYLLPKQSEELGELNLENGDTISYKLLVGADGANSQVRKAMGVQHLSWVYGQTAVVATLQLAQGSLNNAAWQRFLPTGPVALLPLTDELCSLVWSTSTQQAKDLLKLPNDLFVDALNEALWKKAEPPEMVSALSAVARRLLGRSFEASLSNDVPQVRPPDVSSVQEGSRAAFPLGFGHSTSYVAPGVALIGDAAHKVHPLAGQGVNLGYGDISCLVDQLTASAQLGRPLGDIRALQKYESERQLHNVPLMITIDLMARVYSTRNPALRAAGNLALQLADSVQPLKALMMQRAAA